MKMMKKMYARLTATVLSACLLFGSIPMEAFAGQVTDDDAVISTVDSRIDDLGERISSDIDLDLALEEFQDRESRLALYKETADEDQIYDDYFAERYDLIKETVSDNEIDKDLYIEICKSIVDIADDDVTDHEIVIYKDDIDRYISTNNLSAEEWFSKFLGGTVNDYPQFFYWFDVECEHACVLDEYENAYVISFAAYEDEVISEENDDEISEVSVSDNREEADTDTEASLDDEEIDIEETQDVSSDEDDTADVPDDTVSENSVDDKGTVSENEATVDEEVSKDVSTVSENATDGVNGYEPELDVIDPVNISKASISVPVQYYTGSQITPGVNEVVVKVGKKVLTYQDFDIKSYSNNIEVGTAKIEIEGKGDYTGIKQGTFKIAKKPADHAVVFNGNGATGGSMSPIKMSAGKSYSLTQNKFKRDSYTFIHWNTRPDDTGTVYNNGQGGITTANTDPNGMLTLYAIWKPNEYKITYHLCGGPNNASNTVTKYTVGSYDIQILAPKESDWKKGYQFGGWYADSKYTVRMNVIKMGTTGDIDLYAKWVPYTYSVRFDANGGSGHMSDMTCSFGIYKNLPANSYKKDGYVFCGWSSIKYDDAYIEALEDKSGLVMYADKESVVDLIPARNDVNGTATLYAVWRDRFDIKYELNGG
ncbi:MAG: InlB B-repeat-containing protein, partial [Lachnospiraceae bacterium]|nr:InlB B-repeat-containing protein [Lachnospiraceae bacterium]